MGSEVEVIEETIEEFNDVENTIIVAVGTNVKESKSLILWASQCFAGMKICLLHIHQPSPLITLQVPFLSNPSKILCSLQLKIEIDPAFHPAIEYFLRNHSIIPTSLNLHRFHKANSSVEHQLRIIGHRLFPLQLQKLPVNATTNRDSKFLVNRVQIFGGMLMCNEESNTIFVKDIGIVKEQERRLISVNKPTPSLKLNEITIRHHRQAGPPAFIFTALPVEELIKTVGDQWKNSGILRESEGIFIEDAYKLLEGGIGVITDAEELLSDLLSYPLHDLKPYLLRPARKIKETAP
ncbi:hypothetical protein L2E82_43879 [Cichorium intybus]|uniref:Uncharacterized protein n=1 Tax=Cichorium intybus TaxID=13427 RepID=A0ACB8ZPC3_CICIN|nr:hypothetical protein L2E82_43879 [Cichorium intybus]